MLLKAKDRNKNVYGFFHQHNFQAKDNDGHK